MAGRTFIFMGVSGCGKSTVGRAFADATGGVFIDGDDLHPTANIEKMSKGIPLDDGDRVGWLAAILQAIEQSGAAILCIACSALKKSYRDRLRQGAGSPTFIYLEGTLELLQQRLDERSGHFMPPGLLVSQLADFEEPAEAVRADIANPPAEIVAALREEFGL